MNHLLAVFSGMSSASESESEHEARPDSAAGPTPTPEHAAIWVEALAHINSVALTLDDPVLTDGYAAECERLKDAARALGAPRNSVAGTTVQATMHTLIEMFHIHLADTHLAFLITFLDYIAELTCGPGACLNARPGARPLVCVDWPSLRRAISTAGDHTLGAVVRYYFRRTELREMRRVFTYVASTRATAPMLNQRNMLELFGSDRSCRAVAYLVLRNRRAADRLSAASYPPRALCVALQKEIACLDGTGPPPHWLGDWMRPVATALAFGDLRDKIRLFDLRLVFDTWQSQYAAAAVSLGTMILCRGPLEPARPSPWGLAINEKTCVSEAGEVDRTRRAFGELVRRLVDSHQAHGPAAHSAAGHDFAPEAATAALFIAASSTFRQQHPCHQCSDCDGCHEDHILHVCSLAAPAAPAAPAVPSAAADQHAATPAPATPAAPKVRHPPLQRELAFELHRLDPSREIRWSYLLFIESEYVVRSGRHLLDLKSLAASQPTAAALVGQPRVPFSLETAVNHCVRALVACGRLKNFGLRSSELEAVRWYFTGRERRLCAGLRHRLGLHEPMAGPTEPEPETV